MAQPLAWLVGLLLAGVAVGGESASRTATASLPAALQGVISARLGADDPAYRVVGEGARYRAENARHGFTATMGAEGVAIRAGGGEWRLRLTAWGRGEARREAPTGRVTTSANRVEIGRGGVTEWFANGPLGLEQGWTVAAPPRGSAGPLTLVLAQGGSLEARVGASDRALTIADAEGRTVLRYTGLAAYDATGRELPARFEVKGEAVRVRVDDTGADYPVQVDPWLQTAELTASDGADYDFLGNTVAVSADGSTVVAGVPARQVGSNTGQGAAYVFVRSTGGWATATQTAELTASDGASGDLLGCSVAVTGDGSTVVAGAYLRQGGQGAAYVFVRPVGGWVTVTQTAELTTDDGLAGGLGSSVAVSADGATVVAGAPHRNVGMNPGQGAAFVFVKPAGGWATGTQTAELTASDGNDSERFGSSVAVSGDGSTVVAGEAAHSVGSNAQQGAAYVFVRPIGGWATATQTAELTASDGDYPDNLGTSVAVSADGSTVVAGVPGYQVGSNPSQGAAYVFVRPSAGWANGTQTAELTASDGAGGDLLGHSVAVSADGSTVVAGAPPREVGSNSSQGAAYVFARSIGGWATATQTAELSASDGANGDLMGYSVAVSGDGSTIVAGAPYHEVGSNVEQGAVYVFQTPKSLVFTLQPTDTVAGATIGGASGVAVQLRDASGTTPSPLAGVAVQIALAPGTVPLHGTLAATTDATGTATFGDLSVETAGTGYTLTASSAGLTPATSDAFDVTAGAPASIVATGGTPQHALVGTVFAQALEVRVTDGLGNPVSGVAVVFSAPASGPSAMLSNGGSATTDASGHASVTATANEVAGGPYAVTATASGTPGAASFHLTNDQPEPIPVLGGPGLGALAALLTTLGLLALRRAAIAAR